MKSKKYSVRYVLGVALSSMVLTSLPAYAATADQPYYASKSQADVDYIHVLQDSDETSAQMQTQMNEVMKAEETIRHMNSTGDMEQMHAAQASLHNAEAMLTDTMSRMSGVAPKDIEAMHESGLSWGRVSDEIGLKTHVDTQFSQQGGGSKMYSADGQQGTMANTSMQSETGTSGFHSSSNDISMSPRQADSHGGSSSSNDGNGTAMAGNGQGSMTGSPGGTGSGSSSHGMPADRSGYGAMEGSGQNMGMGTMASLEMSYQNGDRLSPMPQGSQGGFAMAVSTGASQYGSGGMQDHGITGAEIDAATSKNLMNGGVSGHGIEVNSSMGHNQSGSMMGGTGGLNNGMSPDHVPHGGSDGGMGGYDSGMGGIGSGGSAGGGMMGGSSTRGMGGRGMVGSSARGMGGSGMGGGRHGGGRM